jgi:hypothetical protein
VTDEAPERPGENPLIAQIFGHTLISALQEGVDEIHLHWRGDTFNITLLRGGEAVGEVPTPPEELWEGIFDRIEMLAQWNDARTGLIRVGLGEAVVDCHVLALARSLSHREVRLILETVTESKE